MGWLLGKTGQEYVNEYDKAINDAKQSKADAAYDYYYNKALYDKNKDYFDSVGVSDPGQSYWGGNGQKTNALADTMNAYGDYLKNLTDERAKVAKQQKYNIYGDGFLPSMFALNSFHQGGTALQDLVTSGTSKWDSGERDAVSDLASIGDAGLTAAAWLTGAGGVAKGAAKSVGQAALKSGARAAAIGGAGSLANYLKQNGTDSNVGEAIGNTALGATIGGALGAGVGAAGYGLGKLQKAAVQNRMGDYVATGSGMSEEAKRGVASLTNDILNNPADYSDDLVKSLRTDIMGSGNLLGSGQAGGDINLANVLSPSTKQMLFEELQSKLGLDSLDFMNYLGMDLKNTLSKDARPLYSQYGVAKSGLGRTLQGAGDYLSTLKNALPDSKLGKAATNLATKASNSKIGQAAGKVMSTRLGKAAAVGGGAFALGKLLGGGGANSETNYDNLSDEELQTLYNYYLTTGGQ